jgi:hypothetical protein
VLHQSRYFVPQRRRSIEQFLRMVAGGVFVERRLNFTKQCTPGGRGPVVEVVLPPLSPRSVAEIGAHGSKRLLHLHCTREPSQRAGRRITGGGIGLLECTYRFRDTSSRLLETRALLLKDLDQT